MANPDGIAQGDDVYGMQPLPLKTADAESIEVSKPAQEEKEVPGLADLDGIKRGFNLKALIIIWTFAILLSFAANLNNQTSNSFAPYATSSFASAPLLGTITVVQAVAASVTLQPIARLADVYGRFELFLATALLLTIGEVMIASSNNIQIYAGAQVFFAIGYIGITLMLQILAGDTSDLHNRALISAIPMAPSLVTCWVAGPFASAIIKISWRWGFGVFAIIIPAVSVPLLATLFHSKRKGAKLRKAEGVYMRKDHVRAFVQLDPLGLLLLAAGLSLILIPISLASSNTHTWRAGHTIAELVLGGVCLIALVIWEAKFAKWPILTMNILKSRTVIFGIIAMLINYAGLYILQSYIIIYELVAANLTVNAATNIYVLIPFAGALGQIGAGFMVKYTKRYKYIVVGGYAVALMGMGLTYKYIDGHGQVAKLVVSQVILGIGQGMVLTTQFGMQAAVSEDEMASVTALNNTSTGVGNAIGSAIAGAMWTGLLPEKLGAHFSSDIADQIVGSLTVATSFPFGSPDRNAINESFTSVFRLMILVGLVLESVALLCSLLIQNQNIKTVDAEREYKGVVIGKTGAADALKDKIHADHDNGLSATIRD